MDATRAPSVAWPDSGLIQHRHPEEPGLLGPFVAASPNVPAPDSAWISTALAAENSRMRASFLSMWSVNKGGLLWQRTNR